MQAIREYAIVRNQQIVLDLPEDFEQMEVEVIILPKESSEYRTDRASCKKHDIHDLVKKLPADYQPEEVEWGKPLGKEIW
ncbi:MAG: hypothetical protein B6245_08230 [Desulfobacteraceae bacterium 4572_88]|nr:MAG: hypothetical protein B6245_08230 [Desulfobacteraceae bacterium 4572_88]RLC18760.1 MAG: hypothetical protein DRI57_08005 [Deltaproteobacteria bacterium]